jgi:protease-4
MSEEQTEQPQVAHDPDEGERSLEKSWRWIVTIGLIIAGIVAGIALSQAVAPQPKIGIVRLYDVIDYYTAPYYLGPLQIAAERNDIAAVVILVDSPGGDATVSEELFYTIASLREEKPVVASIERFGASGAYYAASATNYIYSRPAAQVGSIGVIAYFPEPFPPDEEVLTTGPFKGSGHSVSDFMRDIESVKLAFLTHVYDQRVYVLQNMHTEDRSGVLPPRESIATGQIWAGARAYEIGLIDELGSNQDAIEKAAQLAGVANYEVIDLFMLFVEEDEEFLGFYADDTPDWYEVGPWAELYHLYVMPDDGERDR